MKKLRLLIVMCIVLIAETANAQQQVTNTEKEKKVSYAFFNEYGLSAGVFFEGNPYVEITGVFVNSICFNKKQDMIGVGVGCDAYKVVIMLTIPVFVNYRHNFSSKTNLKPLINVALGTRIGIEGWGWGGYGYGLYSTIAGGFRYKSLSFNAGIFIKSMNDGIFIKSLSDGNYSGGVEIKVGYIF
jgi:hypothetical protein